MRFNRKFIEYFKNKDILKYGINIFVDIPKIEFEKVKQALDDASIDYYYFDDDDDIIRLELNFYDYDNMYDLFTNYKIIYDYDLQEELFNDLISQCFNYNHYLLFNTNCNWRGLSGYTVKENTTDLFFRTYDTTLEYITSTKNGKMIICKEYSHDVPTGGILYFVGLTDKEYQNIDKIDIHKFINKILPLDTIGVLRLNKCL